MQHGTRAQHPRLKQMVAMLAALALVASCVPAALFGAIGQALAATKANEAAVTASVSLSGHELAAHQFSFALYDSSNEKVRVTTNEDDGSIAFPDIAYSAAGTYVYTLAQTSESGSGYTCDSATYTVTVTVTGSGSSLSTSIAYADADGTAVTQPSFSNSYAATGTCTLTAWTELTEGTLVTGQFTFTLEAEADGVPLPSSTSVANAADGSVQFPIAYTHEDAGSTYTYTMSEVDAQEESVASYSDASYVYTVAVVDDGDGTLSFDQTVAEADADADASCEPMFTNVLADGALQVTNTVSSIVYDDTQTFTYTITLSGADVDADGYAYTVYNGDGTYTSYDADGDVTDTGTTGLLSTEAVTETAEVVANSLQEAVSFVMSTAVRNVESLSTTLSAQADAEEGEVTTLYTGTSNTCTWSIDSAGVLSLYPTSMAGADDDDDDTTYTGELASMSSASDVPWHEYASSIETVQITGTVIAGSKAAYLFADCENLTAVEGLSNLSFSSTTSLEGLFADCSSLASIDASSFDTAKVTTMESMFSGCSSLLLLSGLSSWDTAKVTTMEKMFDGCSSLTSLTGFASWDVGSLKNVRYLFQGCTLLTSLDAFTSWDISNVANCDYMFAECSALTSVKLPDGTGVTASDWSLGNLSYMFYKCYALTRVEGFKSWDTSDVSMMNHMFYGCTSLYYMGNEDGDGDYGDGMSVWDVSNVTNFSYMFHGCTSLESLNLKGWDTSSATNMSHMFSSYVDTSSSSANADDESYGDPDDDGEGMALETLILGEDWSTESAGDISYLFAGCYKLENLGYIIETQDSDGDTVEAYSDVSDWDVSGVTTLDYTFYCCYELEALDVSAWDTSNVTSMKRTFSSCKSVKMFDVSAWDTSEVTDMYYMFYKCTTPTTIDVACKTVEADDGKSYTAWDTGNVENMYNMFQGCTALTTLDVSGWDTSSVKGMYAVFADCSSLTELDVSAWDTGSATKMDRLFRNCSSLTELDVSGFDTSNVTRMGQMFYGCSKLTELDVSSFDTSNVTGVIKETTNSDGSTTLSSLQNGMYGVFTGCTSLQAVTFGEEWEFFGSATVASSGTSSSTRAETCSAAYLPTPSCTSGKWTRADATYGPYTADELTDEAFDIVDSATLMAGTWVWYYPTGSYQVKLDANTGTGPYEGELATIVAGLDETSVNLPEAAYYREGYTFAGWSTSADGDVVVEDGATLKSAYDADAETATLSAVATDGSSTSAELATLSAGGLLTLYAQWTETTEEATSTTWSVTVTLSADSYVVFSDVAPETSYTVTDTSTLGTGWTAVGSEGEQGSIAAATTSEAEFTYSYDLFELPESGMTGLQWRLLACGLGLVAACVLALAARALRRRRMRHAG